MARTMVEQLEGDTLEHGHLRTTVEDTKAWFYLDGRLLAHVAFDEPEPYWVVAPGTEVWVWTPRDQRFKAKRSVRLGDWRFRLGDSEVEAWVYQGRLHYIVGYVRSDGLPIVKVSKWFRLIRTQ